MRGRGEGKESRGEGRGKEGERNFLWIKAILGISDHVDMWGDLEGLRNLLSIPEI